MLKHVICAGIATVDLTFFVDKIPRKADKYVADDSQLICGGCGFNAALAVARLNGQASLATVVGNDFFADLIRTTMQDNNISSDYFIALNDFPTPRSSVIIDKKGERQILNYRQPMPANVGFHDQDILKFDAVLGDTRWHKLAEPFLKVAEAQNIPAIMDAEAPIAPALNQLKMATHIAFSETGLADYIADCTLEEALKAAHQEFNAWVCVTRGEKSIISFNGKAIQEHQVFKVDVVDTLGAGDVWHGAFALFLAQGQNEDDAITRANAVAAIKTMRQGGGSGTPTLEELEQFLERNK